MAAFTSSQSGNWSSASTWGGAGVPGIGDTATVSANHTVTVNTNTIVGTSPSNTTTNVLITTNGTGGAGGLTIAPGVTLEVRGNIQHRTAKWEMGAGSTLKFNASNATTPTTSYQFKFSGSPGTRFVATGTQASPISITSDAGGGNGYIVSLAGDTNNYNCSYVTFSRIGTNTLDCMSIDGPTITTYTVTFTNCTWDGCGRVRWMFHPLADGGHSFRDCVFKNGLGSVLILIGGGSRGPNAVREFIRCVFDGPTTIQGNGTVYENCYFREGWTLNSGAQNWQSFRNCFVRLVDIGGTLGWGSFDNCYFLFDYWTGQSALTSGTATSGTSSTLVNSSAGWTNNAYQSAGNTSYAVEITAGTGAGQYRMITSNTTTTLNTNPTWDTTPDATSQYAIYSGAGVRYFLSANPNNLVDIAATSGTTTTITTAASGLVGSDIWPGYTCYFTSGTGAGQSALILSNTANVLTFVSPVAIAADATTRFDVRKTYTISDSVYEYTGCNADGHFWMGLSRKADFVIRGLVGLPNLAKNNSAAVMQLQVLGSTSLVPNSVKLLKSTYFSGQQSISLLVNWTPGVTIAAQLAELKSCIGWNNTGLTYPSGLSGPYLCSIYDSYAGTPGTGTVDFGLVPGGANYNAAYGLSAGYATKGYNINTTNAGANDLAFNTDPQFVDPTRDFASWAVAKGSVSSNFKNQLTDGYGYIKNNLYLINDLLSWTRGGFRPQNTAFKNSGDDGKQIGAIEFPPDKKKMLAATGVGA